MKKISMMQLMFVVSVLIGASACKKAPEHAEGPLEGAGEEIDQAADDASDATEEAVEDAGDKVEEATE